MNSKLKFLLKLVSKVLFIAILIVFIITVIKLPDSMTYSYRPGEETKIITIFKMQIPLDVTKLKGDVIDYIKTLSSGSFGTTTANKPVVDYIKAGLPRTIKILIASIVLSIIFGIIKGVFDSKKEKQVPSNIKLLTTLGLLSMSDVFVIIIIQAGVVWMYKHGMGILPVAGGETFKHSILPTIALSIIPTTYIARITALSMDKIYEQEYIKTALGKGSSRFRVIWIHVFRNAIAQIAGSFSSIATILISSLLLVEYMFYYPGLAYMMYTNYQRNESNVVIGLAITIGIIYFVLDILFKIIKNLLTPVTNKN